MLEIRNMTNTSLFLAYDGELMLRHRNSNALREARRLLGKFQQFTGTEYPAPTGFIAKQFLAEYIGKVKDTTFNRYLAVIQGFMKYIGDPLDLKARAVKTLPEYVESEDIAKLLAAMKERKTHKKIIERDLLVVYTATKTGLRRSGLANLKVEDLDFEHGYITVRMGKGRKDRTVPVSSNDLMQRLRHFCQGKDKGDSLFGLKAATISGKVKFWANKAGVKLHSHSLRDYYATSLLERGATIREVQELLGHSDLKNTERYTLLKPSHLRQAVDRLEDDRKVYPGKEPDNQATNIERDSLEKREKAKKLFIENMGEPIPELVRPLDEVFRKRKDKN